HPGFGSFQALDDRNEDELHALLEDAWRRSDGAHDENVARIGTYYGTCMDSATAETEGMKPIEPELSRIATMASLAELAPEVARLHRAGVFVLFRFNGAPDFKDSRRMIAQAAQGGLGLPDRDYYTKSDSASSRIREEYVAHVGRMFRLIGATEEESRASAQ